MPSVQTLPGAHCEVLEQLMKQPKWFRQAMAPVVAREESCGQPPTGQALVQVPA
jgi:hypothetical protein